MASPVASPISAAAVRTARCSLLDPNRNLTSPIWFVKPSSKNVNVNVK